MHRLWASEGVGAADSAANFLSLLQHKCNPVTILPERLLQFELSRCDFVRKGPQFIEIITRN